MRKVNIKYSVYIEKQKTHLILVTRSSTKYRFKNGYELVVFGYGSDSDCDIDLAIEYDL